MAEKVRTLFLKNLEFDDANNEVVIKEMVEDEVGGEVEIVEWKVDARSSRSIPKYHHEYFEADGPIYRVKVKYKKL